jgi:hypothetical protein
MTEIENIVGKYKNKSYVVDKKKLIFKLGKPIAIDKINAFEKKIGTVLPDDYKQFLDKYGPGSEFFGLKFLDFDNMHPTFRFHPSEVKKNPNVVVKKGQKPPKVKAWSVILFAECTFIKDFRVAYVYETNFWKWRPGKTMPKSTRIVPWVGWENDGWLAQERGSKIDSKSLMEFFDKWIMNVREKQRPGSNMVGKSISKN